MISDSKITIREKTQADAWDDYRWDTDPELAHLDATTPLEISFSDYVPEYTSELRSRFSTSRRLAIDTVDGKHIGNCSYYNIREKQGEAELGIMIGDRDYWNKGYGADAVATLVDYIFRQTKLNRIYLKTLESNIRAQKCFPKCGFTPYDHVFRNGYNFVMMETYRSQWQERQQSETED